MNLPIHTEPISEEFGGEVLHCPICVHYAGERVSDILEGFKRRCNKSGGVLVIYELAD